ncbi:NAD(P)-binding protein [Candidatus Bathyarchaeota archaeon]|nr:NAD(P)-binding protein [Candidatus Bathyarchaeota archaeon]
MLQRETDVAIIGGGPAGLAAAVEARNHGCDVLIIERDDSLGGILQQCIHPGFGLHEFDDELAGPEYAQRYIDVVENGGIDVLTNTMVLEITPTKDLYAISENGVINIISKSIVLAMGCRERTRGAIKIPGYRPTGVYTAGLAQRFVNIEGFMPGTEFVILGSGDIGMIMARRLTWEGATVHGVVEIQPYPSGLIRNKVQCLDDYNIPLYLSHTVVRVHGKDRVTGITISKVDENWKMIPGTEKFINCDTLLLSVGLIPENEITKKAGAALSRTNGPVVNQFLSTTINGIFACGNVLQVHDLVDNVAVEAKKAGKLAALYSKGVQVPTSMEKQIVRVSPGNGVGYVIPNVINLDVKEEFIEKAGSMRFSLRVRKPMQDIYIKMRSGQKELYKKFHRYVRPSEMIIFKIKESIKDFLEGLDIDTPIEVYVEPKNKQPGKRERD